MGSEIPPGAHRPPYSCFSNIFSCFPANRSRYQYDAQKEMWFSQKFWENKVGSEILSSAHRRRYSCFSNIRRGGAKRYGAICRACVHPRTFLRTRLENKLFEFEKRKWCQKFRKVHTAAGTAVSKGFSAVSRQTGRDFRAQFKTLNIFWKNF